VSRALRGLVLDFDGLILDTESPIFESWRMAYHELGLELGLDVWQHALGTHGGFDPCAHLARLLASPPDCEALRARVRARALAGCDAQPVLPGVRERLAEARASGLGTAVASSSTRSWVCGWLERHALGPLVDHVVGRDDVARVKPAPDLFLLAAERLGVRPEECVAFEDSPNGIRAARAAGMCCVAVPNPVTRSLALPEPDLVVASLADVSLPELALRLGLVTPAAASGR